MLGLSELGLFVFAMIDVLLAERLGAGGSSSRTIENNVTVRSDSIVFDEGGEGGGRGTA
jgi:hypothetical protein